MVLFKHQQNNQGNILFRFRKLENDAGSFCDSVIFTLKFAMQRFLELHHLVFQAGGDLNSTGIEKSTRRGELQSPGLAQE